MLASLSGCLSGIGEWDITLYEQKIEGTSKAIYKYDAWGGRDSHKFGYVILDTTEIFKIPSVNNIELDYLIEIPTENLIEVAVYDDVPYKEMKKMKETYFPIQLEEKEIQGIKIKTKHYQEKGFRQAGDGVLKYEFSDFRETKDSICFYDLNYVTYKLELIHRDSLKVKKGQDVTEQIIDKEIRKIIFPKGIVSDSLYKYENFRETKDSICIYNLKYRTFLKQFGHKDSVKIKKGHVIIRQDISNQIIAIETKRLIFSELVNDSLISKRHNVFKPKSEVKSTEFSNYGIFKAKSTVPNNE
jgi:hypothetical protein